MLNNLATLFMRTADANKHLWSCDWDEHSAVERGETNWSDRGRTASYAGKRRRSTYMPVATCIALAKYE